MLIAIHFFNKKNWCPGCESNPSRVMRPPQQLGHACGSHTDYTGDVCLTLEITLHRQFGRDQ